MSDAELAAGLKALREAPKNASIMELMAFAGLTLQDFRGGDWRGCDFRGVDLTGANFSEARIFKAKFRDAIVNDADFRGTETWGCDFHLARNWRAAKLDPAQRRFLEQRELQSRTEKPGDLEQATSTGSKAGPLSTYEYNLLIKAAENYPAAKAVFYRMVRAEISPDEWTFSALIDKTPDAASAREEFTKMQELGISPDNAVYNALMDKMPLEEARRIFAQMVAAGLTPTIYDHNVILKKLETLSEALSYFEVMRKGEEAPNDISYNIAMNKACTLTEITGLLDQMEARGINARPVDLAAAIRRLKGRRSVDALLDKFKNSRALQSTDVYNALIAMASQFRTAVSFYDNMIRERIVIDRHTIYALLSKAANFDEACQVLKNARVNRIQFDWDMADAFTLKATDRAGCRTILVDVERSGGTPLEALKRMVGAGLRPDRKSQRLKDVFGRN